MIKVKILKKENQIYAFELSGHAEYDEHGKDIICSAVSMLVINTLNSINHFTDDHIILEANNEKTGHIRFRLDIEEKPYSSETDILLKSLEFGLQSAREHYGKKYIDIEEVQWNVIKIKSSVFCS